MTRSNAFSRRAFVAGAGLVALTPQRLFAKDKIILGAGAHKYEWIPNWAKMPEGVAYGSTHGCVAVDAKNRIFVNSRKNPIMIFEQGGKFIKAFAKEFSGNAHGMIIHKEGDEEFICILI